MTAAARSGALPAQPAALAKRIAAVFRHAGPGPVILVRAAPDWPHPPGLTLPDGVTATVAACVSGLDLWDQLARHDGTAPLVLLTDLESDQIGVGALARVWRQQPITVEPWDVIRDEFSASGLAGDLFDPSLRWLPEALLAARPAGGWLPVGGLLTRDTALARLAAVRLRLDTMGVGAADLDLRVLLQWSGQPDLPQAWLGLRQAERAGLTEALIGALGPAAKAVFSLADAGHAADAVPLGLVCHALWSAAGPEVMRARGRLEHWFGTTVNDEALTALADAAVGLVTDLLDRVDAADTLAAYLRRGDDLLTQFGGGDAAAHADWLTAGAHAAHHRLARVITDHLANRRRGDDLRPIEQALAALDAHRIAARDPDRLRRAHAAARLLRWLAAEPEAPAGVGEWVARQVAEWAWVDRALAEVWLGAPHDSDLDAVYRQVYQRANRRRKDLDKRFSTALARSGAAGSVDKGPLLVERLLSDVVAPIVRPSGPPLLLVVLDGMSTAVAVELAEQITAESFVEYDPTGTGARRGVVAALPTVTEVSRASLFAGTVTTGAQDTERRAFASHPWWRSGEPVLLHKEPHARALLDEVTSERRVVAVVVNTVDDALGPGREAQEAGWDLARVGPLRHLLRAANAAGRAVILTSDHGHVLHRGGELLRVDGPAKARYRIGGPASHDGEVALAGPRVRPEEGIVALWDTDLRYRQRKGGYHGGASLAEVVIPLLAYVPFGHEPPTGWVALDVRPPTWWTATDPPARPAATAKPTAPPEPQTYEPLPLFAPPTTPPAAVPDLVQQVLDSELFQAQRGLTPRKLPAPQVGRALAALLDAGGTAPVAVVAEHAGVPQARAVGFITTLQRVFNIDGFDVLAVIDQGRTAHLDLSLLRTQFGLSR